MPTQQEEQKGSGECSRGDSGRETVKMWGGRIWCPRLGPAGRFHQETGKGLSVTNDAASVLPGRKSLFQERPWNNLFSLFLFYYFVYVGVSPAYMSMYHIRAKCLQNQKGTLAAL